MVVAVVVVLALVAAGLVFVLVGDDGEEVAAGELFLEPVASVGVDPFTDPVADEPDAALEAFAAGDGDESAGGSEVAALSELSLVSVEGSRPGLYGGSRERASCDVDRLVSFLEGEANRDKAEAFASVLGIDVDEIESFVSDLTPVVLGEDTAVTNHGFSEGEATPRRSVLQRGTAVLVDDEGVPRVKCYCGNPLAPPEPLDASEDADLEVRGEAWAAFDPDAVSTVDPADEAMEELVLTDVEGGDMFTRPVGTSGEADRELEPTTTTTTEPTTTTTTTTPERAASESPCTADLSRLEPAVPQGATRVEEATGDLDADGRDDRIVTYAIETGDRTSFFLRLILATGYTVEVPLDEASEVAPVRPLGAAAIGGSEGTDREVAFVLEQTGASTANVSLWALAEAPEPPCAPQRILLADHTAAPTYPVGASSGSGAGLACDDIDGDGTDELLIRSWERVDEDRAEWTELRVFWPGMDALRSADDVATGTFELPRDEDELGAFSTLRCPGVESP